MNTPKNVCLKHNRFTAIKYDGTNLEQVREVLGYDFIPDEDLNLIGAVFVTQGDSRYCMTEEEFHQRYGEVTQARDMIRIYSNQDSTLFVESYRYNPREVLTVLKNLVFNGEYFLDDQNELTTNVWVPRYGLTVNPALMQRSRETGKTIIRKYQQCWEVYCPTGRTTYHATHQDALKAV